MKNKERAVPKPSVKSEFTLKDVRDGLLSATSWLRSVADILAYRSEDEEIQVELRDIVDRLWSLHSRYVSGRTKYHPSEGLTWPLQTKPKAARLAMMTDQEYDDMISKLLLMGWQQRKLGRRGGPRMWVRTDSKMVSEFSAVSAYVAATGKLPKSEAFTNLCKAHNMKETTHAPEKHYR